MLDYHTHCIAQLKCGSDNLLLFRRGGKTLIRTPNGDRVVTSHGEFAVGVNISATLDTHKTRLFKHYLDAAHYFCEQAKERKTIIPPALSVRLAQRDSYRLHAFQGVYMYARRKHLLLTDAKGRQYLNPYFAVCVGTHGLTSVRDSPDMRTYRTMEDAMPYFFHLVKCNAP